MQKKGLSPKEIHEDMVNELGESAPSYQVVKNISREFNFGGELLRCHSMCCSFHASSTVTNRERSLFESTLNFTKLASE